jgi:hypothetical protein
VRLTAQPLPGRLDVGEGGEEVVSH